jgi:hypothetical protein
MRKINLIISMSLVSFLLLSLNVSIVTGSENKNTLLEEARILYKADSRYVDARFKSQWETIYSFQHPEYQKAISSEEFQYFSGHVPTNYREDRSFKRNVSGYPLYPSVEDIKRDPIKKDPFLGVPLPPIYRFIPDPNFNFTGHKFEKVYLDDRGTLGKVEIRLNVIQSPPTAVMNDFKIRRDILYIDYWEKINGKWVLAVIKQFSKVHVSGAVTKEHPVPKDKFRWDKAVFTEFNPEDFK